MKDFLKTQLNHLISKQTKLVFTHIPKCAGSSLSLDILNGLYSPIVRHSPLTTGIDIVKADQIATMINTPAEIVRQVMLGDVLSSPRKVFVSGHCFAPPELVKQYCNEWKFITVLRKPEERFVSEFVYNTYKKVKWKNNSLDIQEYLNSESAQSSGNTYARYFSGMSITQIKQNPKVAIKSSIDNLSKFHSIGFVDNLSVWVSSLNKDFDAKINLSFVNKTPNNSAKDEIESNEALMAQIREINAVDTEIFNHATKEFR